MAFDFRKLFEIFTRNKIEYEDFYFEQPEPDENMREFEENEIKFNEKLEKFSNCISSWDQHNNKKGFKHICFGEGYSEIKYRIYLSPKMKNLHKIINDLIKHNIKDGVYLKYSRDPSRVDRIIMYIKNKEELGRQLSVISNIKADKPELFKNMKRSPIWYCEASDIKDVFIAPETPIKGLSSYGVNMSNALTEVRNLMKYLFGCTEREFREHIFTEEDFKTFKNILHRTTKRYGICIEDAKTYDISIGHPSKEGKNLSHIIRYDDRTKALIEARVQENGNYKFYIFTQSQKQKYFSTDYIELLDDIETHDMPQKEVAYMKSYPSLYQRIYGNTHARVNKFFEPNYSR
jgi:hypothetical protein